MSEAPGDRDIESEQEAVPTLTPEPGIPRKDRSLTTAVITALILLGLVAVFYLLGRNAFFVLICFVVLAALFELFDGLRQAGHRPVTAFGLAAGLAMLIVAFRDEPRHFASVIALAMVGSFLLALRPVRGATPSSDAAWTVLGVAWIAGGGAGATMIMMIDDGGLRLLVAFILIAALDDIGAYFVGTALGKHKMAPSISPNKSWEGFAGGWVTSLLAGLAFGALLPDELGITHGLAIGAICGLLAPAGDLVESLFKREIGIKDSGRLLPGHGGFLDRLDAIVFCAPVVALYLRFVVL